MSVAQRQAMLSSWLHSRLVPIKQVGRLVLRVLLHCMVSVCLKQAGTTYRALHESLCVPECACSLLCFITGVQSFQKHHSGDAAVSGE